jgi:predicted DNA-binding protein YlxM (UPF0122 family)
MNKGWSVEMVLKPRLVDEYFPNDDETTLNEIYPNNKNTFFYFGTRSENKFYHHADGEPFSGYTRVTSELVDMETCACCNTGVTNSRCIFIYPPKSKDDIIKLIHEEVNGFSPNDFYDALNEMIHKNQIQLQSEGFVLNRLSIDEYILSNKNDKSVQILKFYLDGLNYREIGIKFKVSRQRIEQIIKKTLEKFPVFKNEFKYFSLIKEYDLRIELLNELGFKDLTLINYLKLKYELNPKKNEIDYLLQKATDNAEYYALRLQNYLIAYSNQIPQYLQSVGNQTQIYPDQTNQYQINLVL